MKLLYAMSFFFLSTLTSLGQDVIKTTAGDVTIYPVLHGSVAMKWNDMVILVDPYGGAQRFDAFGKPDLILITDIHGDHLNEATLDGMNLNQTDLVVPQAVYDKISDTYKDNCSIIGNGETSAVDGIEILAVPMYNLPESEDSRHTKGRGNGYVLTIGGKKLYLSGDTEDIQEMRDLKNIDVAFVCMNLPYTMDVEQAADAVNEFKPKVVYPYHFRGSEGLSDTGKFKNLVNKGIEVRLRDWYPK